jgi:hypothetical protein
MAIEKTFKDMANDKDWINNFYKKIREYPIVIEFQPYLGEGIPKELHLNPQIDIFNIEEFGYINCQLKILVRKKDITFITGESISLLDEFIKLRDVFMELGNEKIYKYDIKYISRIVLLNFFHKCYNQEPDNTIYDLFIDRIKNKNVDNDRPLFTLNLLQQFYNSDLQTEFLKFSHKATNDNDLLKLFKKNEIIKAIEEDNTGIIKNDIARLIYVSTFISFSSENDTPIDIPYNTKIRNSKHITPDVLYKLIQIRDKLVNKEKKKVAIQAMTQTAEEFSNTTTNRFVYTALRDWLQDNANVLPELKGKKAKEIIQVLDKNLILKWFKSLKKIDPYFYNQI